MKKRVFLIGFPKAGKTTLGRKLAEKFHLNFLDTDEEILKRTMYPSIRELFLNLGMVGFRKIEEEIFSKISAFNGIISTGGGTPLSTQNQEIMKKKGIIVYVEEIREVLFQRMIFSGIPSYLDPDHLLDSFTRLINTRKPIYDSLADCRVQSTMGLDDIWEVIRLAESLKSRHGVNHMAPVLES